MWFAIKCNSSWGGLMCGRELLQHWHECSQSASTEVGHNMQSVFPARRAYLRRRESMAVGWKSAWVAGLFVAAALARQPIAFPHNTHMKLGLDCLDCHIGADTRAAAG